MVATICFIIGPMGDAKLGNKARLKILANEIIKPLLEEEEWNLKVRTPFDIDGVGLIMDNVIASIDHADLIFADLTGNNPNVFYELALCHSLGIPVVILKEDDHENVAFDVRAFSYNPIQINDPSKSISVLRPVIKRIKREIESWALFSNPITNFYRAPVTNISPSAGLAQGFYHNFVEPTGTSLSTLNPEGDAPLYSLSIDGQDIPKKIDARRGIQLNLIIPSELRYTSTDRVQQVKATLKKVDVQTKHRTLTMLANWDDTQNCYQLYDIPTTMNIIIQSIDRRANQLNVKRDSQEWKQLEEQETGRFHLALKQWIDENTSDLFKERVKIIQFDIKGRDPKMDWLYKIWGL
jgi:hypothetical protein